MLKEEERFLDSDIMEGMISFRAVIKAMENSLSDRKVRKVLVDKSKVRALSSHLSYIKAMSFKYGFEIELCDREVIDSYAVGSSHGGILTFCSERTIPPLEGSCVKENGFYMMLDGIEDPYNFGYCLRSLYASGVDGVILPPRNWMSASGVVCRASAGSSEELALYTAKPEDAGRIFKEKGYTVVCSDTNDAVSIWDANLKLPVFAVIGGEKRGISAPLMELCDQNVVIPYGRDFPAALSAASASAVIAFEILRQNKGI